MDTDEEGEAEWDALDSGMKPDSVTLLSKNGLTSNSICFITVTVL